MRPLNFWDRIVFRVINTAFHLWCSIAGHDWNGDEEEFCSRCGDYRDSREWWKA